MNDPDQLYFYEQVYKISTCPRDRQQQELNNISAYSDNQETDNIKPKIVHFQEAQEKIEDIQNSLQKKNEINQNVQNLNSNSQKMCQFFNSNQKTIAKIKELKTKKDFCASLRVLINTPNEILVKVKKHEYQLATEYLISTMNILLNPKYNSHIINSVKQQFSQEYISNLNASVEFDMFTENTKNIKRSIEAAYFQVTCQYYNISQLNNPHENNDLESKKKSIIEVLSAYFIYLAQILTKESTDILGSFIKAGNNLLSVDGISRNNILKLKYLNCPETQAQNQQIKNEIENLSIRCYTSIYNEYLKFFYTKEKVFKSNEFIDAGFQSKKQKEIENSWGKLISKPTNISYIMLVSGINDLKKKCSCMDVDNLIPILDNFDKLFCLSQSIKELNTSNQNLQKLFHNYHLGFCFDPQQEQKFIAAFVTFTQFAVLLNQIDKNAFDYFYFNFSSRISSALGNYIARSSLNNENMIKIFKKITSILNQVYPDTKSKYSSILRRIEKAGVGIPQIANLFVYQALNNITEHFLYERLDEGFIENIKRKEIEIAQFLLNLLGKSENAVNDMVIPFQKLLKVQKKDV